MAKSAAIELGVHGAVEFNDRGSDRLPSAFAAPPHANTEGRCGFYGIEVPQHRGPQRRQCRLMCVYIDATVVELNS
jgi:hypothetical protein